MAKQNPFQIRRTRRRLYELTEDETTENLPTVESNIDVVNKLIINYMQWSKGVNFVPLSVLNNLSLQNLQYKMVREIADYYGIKHSKLLGTALITSLIIRLRGFLPFAKAKKGLINKLPGMNILNQVMSYPNYAAAFTFALGKIFQEHFEQGGDFLNFDSNSKRNTYLRFFDEAKKADN